MIYALWAFWRFTILHLVFTIFWCLQTQYATSNLEFGINWNTCNNLWNETISNFKFIKWIPLQIILEHVHIVLMWWWETCKAHSTWSFYLWNLELLPRQFPVFEPTYFWDSTLVCSGIYAIWKKLGLGIISLIIVLMYNTIVEGQVCHVHIKQWINLIKQSSLSKKWKILVHILLK